MEMEMEMQIATKVILGNGLTLFFSRMSWTRSRESCIVSTHDHDAEVLLKLNYERGVD